MNRKGKYIKRNEYPGGHWLFVKVYGSPALCDRLLTKTVYPAIIKMKKAAMIERWFFVRYSDPDFHLRLRIELNDPKLQSDILNILNRNLVKLCNERLLHKLVVDTYKREIERYGSKYMDLTETLFYIDSENICKLLDVLRQRDAEHERWKLAFVIIDRMMEAFGLNVTDKRSLTGDMSRAYLKEFGFNQHNVKHVAAQYRRFKTEIALLLQADNDLDGCRNIIDGYRMDVQQTLADAETSAINLTSLLHMSMNRLFAIKNRLNEMMLHYCLERYYTSEIFRNGIDINHQSLTL